MLPGRAASVRILIAMACMAAGAPGVTRAQEAAPPPATSTAPADSARVDPHADLGPTTAPPWNPPRPESGTRLWE